MPCSWNALDQKTCAAWRSMNQQLFAARTREERDHRWIRTEGCFCSFLSTFANPRAGRSSRFHVRSRRRGHWRKRWPKWWHELRGNQKSHFKHSLIMVSSNLIWKNLPIPTYNGFLFYFMYLQNIISIYVYFKFFYGNVLTFLGPIVNYHYQLCKSRNHCRHID